MTAQEARRHYIDRHPLGHLTITQLKAKAMTEDIPVYGDKAQILQCFDQSRHMTKMFKVCRR